MRRLLLLTVGIAAAVLSPLSRTARAQEGRFDSVAFASSGRFAPNVNVAVCTTLTTTAASVTSNVATLTFASNPITAGFVATATLTVSGFTGGDTYFNGTFTISATSSTTISYPLTHANASAGTNGTVYQTGSATQACAALATIFTDSTGGTTATNPFTADGLGNYGFWAAPGQYKVQLYGPTITTTISNVSIACVPSNTVNCGALLGTPNTWTAAQTDSALHTFNAGINSTLGPNTLIGTTTVGSNVNPQFAGVTPLGTTSLPFLSLIVGGAAGQTTTQTSTATANRTATWPDASGTPSLAAIEYCGATSGATQACAKTVQTLPIIVWGDVLLNGATTQSITTLPFTDALYSCSGSDLTTPAGVVAFNTYAAASVTIQETGGANTDHLRWLCVGH